MCCELNIEKAESKTILKILKEWTVLDDLDGCPNFSSGYEKKNVQIKIGRSRKQSVD